jgi:hypothetical protein
VLVALLMLGSQLPQVPRLGLLHTHAQEQLPPVSYICPMDAEVVDDKPGRCPICRMDLEPVRLDIAWSCPNHAAVITTKPGVCPIDKRELVQVTVSKYWSCPDATNSRLLEPGNCANGQPRKLEQALRAHGDHNPRYGGQFFMAADKWHHLEGTYPRAGQFRMYFYDNFTKPISPKEFTGRLVTREENNREIASVPLSVARDGLTLEASIPNTPAISKEAPLRVAAKLVFKKGEPEQRFDFTFTEISVAPPTAPGTGAKPAPQTTAAATTGAKPAPATASAAQPAPAAAPSASPAPGSRPPMSGVTMSTPMATTSAGSSNLAETMTNCNPTMSRLDAVALGQTLPKVSSELLRLLALCSTEVDTLIKDGQFGFVYQPTMLSKDIAIALEDTTAELPNRQRAQASNAIRRVVLAAWMLDLYGDLGNREKLTESYNTFAAAIADIKTAYGSKP